jgi:hypothetical protein
MDTNDTSLYDKAKEVLLNYPAMRWSSRGVGPKAPVIALEKIEAVRVPVVDAFFLKRILSNRGQSLIYRRMSHRDTLPGWLKLYELFDGQECLVYRQSTEIKGVTDVYILVRIGLYYEGIKTKEIEVTNGR